MGQVLHHVPALTFAVKTAGKTDTRRSPLLVSTHKPTSNSAGMRWRARSLLSGLVTLTTPRRSSDLRSSIAPGSPSPRILCYSDA